MGRSTVTGISGLNSALEKVGQKIHDASAVATDQGAESLAQDMRDLAPVDEGELLDSIEARDSEDGTGKDVGSFGVEHAGFVEFGTSKMAAQPYATPAAEAERTQFPGRVRGEVERALP